MDILSNAYLVLFGIIIGVFIGRPLLKWGYDLVLIATLIVLFGVEGISLIVFSKFGLAGLVATPCLAFILTMIFVKFHLPNAINIKKLKILGCCYWFVLLVILTDAGFKFGTIVEGLYHIYGISNSEQFLYGAISSLLIMIMGVYFMFFYECKRFLAARKMR